MNSFTVVGNLTDDPELRFTPSGAPVANFNIAETPRKFDSDTKSWKDAGATNFYRCTVWNKQAENVADSLRKGTRVIANGKLKTEKYERNGETVTSTNNFDIDHIGPSLSRATAVVTKNPSEGDNYNRGGNSGYASNDPAVGNNSGWSNGPAGGNNDNWNNVPSNDPPF